MCLKGQIMGGMMNAGETKSRSYDMVRAYVEVEEALIMCGVMHLMSSIIFHPTRNGIVQF